MFGTLFATPHRRVANPRLFFIIITCNVIDKLIYIYIGCGPLLLTVANGGLQESPTKHVIILVVTVTGRGGRTQYVYIYIYVF